MATNEQLDGISSPGLQSSTSHPLHRAISYIDHDLELKVDNLAQAKDRAQLTATGAMSVVHVALLKEVLDKGKDNLHYFTVSLTLICVSLVLQIIAGILALLVSHMRSYYAKYRDDLIEDTFENLCCCRVVSAKAVSSRKLARARLMKYGEDVVDASGDAGVHITSDDNIDEYDEPTTSRLRCCGCSCGCYKSMSNYEYDILQMFDDWGAEHTELELLGAEADVQLPYLTELMQDAKRELNDLETIKSEMSDMQFNSKFDTLTKKIEDIQQKRRIFHECQRKLAISNARGDILMIRSDSVRRNRVLKMASFWQQMINYVFYVVFICNAFITGLGIASK